jgi:pantothenate kinase type III
MAAGLYWGAIGAIREIIRQQTMPEELPCELFLTGGDALQLANELQSQGRPVRCQEQMVLTGIWLVGQELS